MFHTICIPSVKYYSRRDYNYHNPQCNHYTRTVCSETARVKQHGSNNYKLHHQQQSISAIHPCTTTTATTTATTMAIITPQVHRI